DVYLPMNFRCSADQAGWSIREAAWDFEERVLWRGSDAAQTAVDRAARATEPLQRLVQTKLTWPLADAYRARGRKTRAALATSAVVVAVGAGAARAVMAPENAPAPHRSPAARLAPTAASRPGSDSLMLQGVTPQFQAADSKTTDTPPAPAAEPTEKPAQVAWDFAHAFVAYEVGRSGKEIEATFAATATKQLAKALKKDPPRLPATGTVPQARPGRRATGKGRGAGAPNVGPGTGSKTRVTAGVSLVRLRAMSELRLTLSRTDHEWRVGQVLG